MKDPDKTVDQLVAEASKRSGKTLKVLRFDRFVLGGSSEAGADCAC